MKSWISLGMLFASTVGAYAGRARALFLKLTGWRVGCDGCCWFNRGAHLGTQAEQINTANRERTISVVTEFRFDGASSLRTSGPPHAMKCCNILL